MIAAQLVKRLTIASSRAENLAKLELNTGGRRLMKRRPPAGGNTGCSSHPGFSRLRQRGRNGFISLVLAACGQNQRKERHFPRCRRRKSAVPVATIIATDCGSMAAEDQWRK
jgi:hypothetical protein